jgi:DUF917 family protein
VLAFPSPDVWRTDAGLAVVGPETFGYRFPYVPVQGGGDAR